MNRKEQLNNIDGNSYDVTIIGGGISGSKLYADLCERGYKVLLVDKGDFGCGTSQASGMMVWGGLLYLKNLDFKTVHKLCKARDRFIEGFPELVERKSFRYMPCKNGGRNRSFVQSVLYLYWLLGSRKRHLPRGEKDYSESSLIREELFKKSLSYEEAFLNLSDCRFVLNWLMPWKCDRTQALNYCEISQAQFKGSEWQLELTDHLSGNELTCRSKFIVNAAGVWTDEVNKNFDIQSDYKHVFSKGVYMNLARKAGHESPVIFEMGEHGDSQSYVPWGPVSMWGPTETAVDNIADGFRVDQSDVDFLLKKANHNLRDSVTAKDIVSLRCGIRPLAVKASYNSKTYPIDLSRRYEIHRDRNKNFMALYGGKLTSCGLMAEEVCRSLKKELKPGKNIRQNFEINLRMKFPSLEDEMPSPEWCRDYEACQTLEDYLRRRSNISQWVSNEGFGKDWQNEEFLIEIAKTFHGDEASRVVDEFKAKCQNNILRRM